MKLTVLLMISLMMTASASEVKTECSAMSQTREKNLKITKQRSLMKTKAVKQE